MTNRVLAGLCLLVLGLLIGVTDYSRSVTPDTPAIVIAHYLLFLWFVVGGLHKGFMLIAGEGSAIAGGIATTLWLVVLGIFLAVGHSAGAPPAWPQVVLSFLVFLGWPVVDVVGILSDY